jgi:hypothetical protein
MRTKSQWYTRNVLSARFAAFSPKSNIDRPLCTTLKYEPSRTMGFFVEGSGHIAIPFKMDSALVMSVFLPRIPQKRMKDHDERTQGLC